MTQERHNKSRIRRVGPEFDNFTRMLIKNLQAEYDEPIVFRQVTDDIARFCMSQGIHERMINRSRYVKRVQKRRGGYF